MTTRYKIQDTRYRSLSNTLIAFCLFLLPCFTAHSAGDLTIGPGGRVKLEGGSLEVEGDVIFEGGGLDAESGTITVEGSWQKNEGNFNSGTSTVIFEGTSGAYLTGNNTFYNLTLSSQDGPKTISLGADQTQTITGTLRFKAYPTKLLKLRSNQGGTQTILKIPSSITRGVDYVDVKDSRVYSPHTISCDPHCWDSGNNAGWIFYQTPPEHSPEPEPEPEPDTTPPQVTDLTPAPNSGSLETQPVISFRLSDNNSGVNSESLRVALDGQDITNQLRPTEEGALRYTPPEPLSETTHTVSVSLSDLAGNSGQVSWSFTIYSGQIVTEEGATLHSPDVPDSNDQATLDIPPEAVTSPIEIAIIPIDIEPLRPAVPEEKDIIAAVRCLPSGASFNQPVQLTYIFGQAQVPGTVVELGLYDPVADQITPSGQTYQVGADGYTATFSLTHFSTYAALTPLTPTGAPIGGGVKIPLPDMFTGAFSHSVPLTVVPGRKGIQPNLGLTYRSSNPNSWLGVGFGLNHGHIVRSTRLGPPSYNDTEDTFYFISDAGTTELVHLIDNLYQAKIESSFTKFYKEADGSWRVISKDGSLIFLGQSPSSKETAPLGTYSWHVTRAQDTNGNYMDYSYIKDQGKCYLARIDYTGNTIGVAPTNTVEFFLEDRGDIPSSYISGGKITTAKRLKEIQVKVNSELVWQYILEYIQSPDTDRSLLQSVTQYGADGASFPTQTFTYQEAE